MEMPKILSTPVQETLPPLVESSLKYRLVVPRKVEEKIRYLIRKFPNTEWSGVLFTSHKGTFENNDLVITCEDFYPMDLGTTGWTEFKISPDVASYVAEHIELFDCNWDLIHSHHSMGAFFSGQDKKMLRQEGADTTCFVSLVVDTKGTYVAALTRKVQIKKEVTTKELGKSYEFFGDGEVRLDESSDKSPETTKEVVDETYIECFGLNVEIEKADNPLEYLDTRFDEIQKNKKAKWSNISTNIPASTIKDIPSEDPFDFTFDTWRKQKEENSKHESNKGQLTFFDDTVFQPVPEKSKPVINNLDIHRWVSKMLVCSLTLNTEKFNLQQWIRNHMDKVYKKLFPDSSPTDTFYGSLDDWISFTVEFILGKLIEYSGDDDSDMAYKTARNQVIEEMMMELENYRDDSPYIPYYIEQLDSYIE